MTMEEIIGTAAPFAPVIALIWWAARQANTITTLKGTVDKLEQNQNRQWKKLDTLEAMGAVHDRQLSTITSMMDPANVEQFHRSDERIKADISMLKGHMDFLMSKHYKGG